MSSTTATAVHDNDTSKPPFLNCEGCPLSEEEAAEEEVFCSLSSSQQETMRSLYEVLLMPSTLEPSSNNSKITLSDTRRIELTDDEKQFFLSQECLYRYCVARGWDIQKTYTMLVDSILWRRELEPEKLTAREVKNYDRDGKLYMLKGRDLLNQPVVFVKLHLDRMENVSISEKLKIVVYHAELARKLSKSQSLCLIVDFQQVPILKIDRSLCSEIIKTMSSQYPELLGFAMVVNAPSLFYIIWKLVSSLLDERTKSKVFVVNTDQEKIYETMRKMMPHESIPEEYGGSLAIPEWNCDEYFDWLEELEDKHLPDRRKYRPC